MRSASFAAALASTLLVATTTACSPAPAAAERPRPVLVAHPGGAGAATTSYAGEVRAREESTLAFRVGGHLVERRVDVGDHVRRGDLLAVLDPGDLQAQARAARARLLAAESQLQRAVADRARYAALAKQQLVSRSALEAQDAAAAAARGEVDAARESLAVARNQSAYTQLRAPRDGVIASRLVEAGQVVAAGQPVYTLAGDGVREVAFAVGEAAVRAVRPGQPVQVEIWSMPGRRAARVREVAPAADPVSRTYAVRAAIDDATGVELGASARVYADAAAGGALTVPLSALQRDARGGTAVFVVDPTTGTARLRPVRIGAFGSDVAPVVAGVTTSDWIVAAGGHLLRDGEKVAPIDRDNRPVKR